MKFKIYYGDGSTYEGEDFDIFDAPPIDVQAIAQDGPGNWHVVSHCHFYVWDAVMNFCGVDDAGYWQYMFKPQLHIVLFGQTIHTPVFQTIFQEALAFADARRREVSDDSTNL